MLSSINVRATNLIAAVSSEGEFFFTVNVGNTNGHSYSLFIMKLVTYLDK